MSKFLYLLRVIAEDRGEDVNNAMKKCEILAGESNLEPHGPEMSTLSTRQISLALNSMCSIKLKIIY